MTAWQACGAVDKPDAAGNQIRQECDRCKAMVHDESVLTLHQQQQQEHETAATNTRSDQEDQRDAERQNRVANNKGRSGESLVLERWLTRNLKQSNIRLGLMRPEEGAALHWHTPAKTAKPNPGKTIAQEEHQCYKTYIFGPDYTHTS